MTGGRVQRGATWALASGVAAIAAIVSYSHIYDLGRAHGGSGTAARLLPLSVDMLILVGELMLLHEADARGRRFVLGWVLVWSGIVATMAANITYGAQFGAEGAVIWGWPAYSFILVAAGMVAMTRRARAGVPDSPAPGPALAPVPEAVPVVSAVPGELNGHAHAAAELFHTDLQAGRVPGIRKIRSGLHVGQDKAAQVQAYLRELAGDTHA